VRLRLHLRGIDADASNSLKLLLTANGNVVGSLFLLLTV